MRVGIRGKLYTETKMEERKVSRSEKKNQKIRRRNSQDFFGYTELFNTKLGRRGNRVEKEKGKIFTTPTITTTVYLNIIS